jgi:DNA-directed RNA polymerase specialized sigma24 family protein
MFKPLPPGARPEDRPRQRSHEDVFLGHYQWLLRWALHLAAGEQADAEDLLHEAFVRFTVTRPDLATVRNVEGYLHTLLRNLHLSQVRRKSLVPTRSLTLADYDSAELALRAVDPWTNAGVRNDLASICEYALARRHTSKAGSILILRYFHGYYSGEIARVLRGSLQAVHDWLRIARTEARACLADPESLRFLDGRPKRIEMATDLSSEEFLARLRAAILAETGRGCGEAGRLDSIFPEAAGDKKAPAVAVDAPFLAHLVACARCLDEVNQRLGMALLSDRTPTDTTRRGPGDGSPRAPSAGPPRPTGTSRRVGQTIDHRPNELRILVNGFPLGSHKITSARSEQTLGIKLDERVGFVEIFSEQDVGLCYLEVEPPPDGPVEQRASVALSDDRRLEVGVSFGGAWPQLHLLYTDPMLAAAPGSAPASENAASVAEEATGTRRSGSRFDELKAQLAGVGLRWLGRLRALRPQRLLRPRSLLVTLSLALMAAVWILRSQAPAVSAAELLRRSAERETAVLSAPDVAVRRVVRVEERRRGDARLVDRRRVEVWRTGGGRVQAKRAYGVGGQLLAGEWTGADGSRTVYRTGRAPETDRAPATARDAARTAADVLDRREIWRLEPSAEAFTALVPEPHRDTAVRVDDSRTAYVVRYDAPTAQPSPAAQLLSASLTMSKAELHAFEARLIVRHPDGEREYRLIEGEIESVPAAQVAPGVFQPEPDLLGRPAAPAAPPPRPKPALAPPLDMDRLELLTSRELYRRGLWLGQRSELTRTPAGELLARATVSSEERKQVLLRELAGLDPRVRLEVEVAALSPEAGARLDDVASVDARSLPAYEAFRAHFLRQLGQQRPSDDTSAAVKEAVRDIATWVLGQVARRAEHVRALETLTARWPETRLRSLEADAIVTWQWMIQGHGRAIEQDTSLLRVQLEPALAKDDSPASSPVPQVSRVEDVPPAVRRLVELVQAQDAELHAAFTACAAPPCAAWKTGRLRRSLAETEALAASFGGLWTIELPLREQGRKP